MMYGYPLDSDLAADIKQSKKSKRSRTQANCTIYFNDRNSVSRDGDDNLCTVSGNVSNQTLAFAAGQFCRTLLNWADQPFNDQDVVDCAEEWDGSDSVEAVVAKGDNYWIQAMEGHDYSGGDSIVYRITYKGRDIYYNKDLEEYAEQLAYNNDRYIRD